MEYMIRDTKTGAYSSGFVINGYDFTTKSRKYVVRFKERGKIWTSEKLIKKHLLNCALKKVNMDTWEVIEVKYLPTKPIFEWFDEKMSIQLLK